MIYPFAQIAASLSIIILLSGCNDQAVIMASKAVSPDGIYVAEAETTQYGGPGTAGLYTYVSLRLAKIPKRKAANILTLSHLLPYTQVHVEMVWKDPEHLDVIFDHSEIDFEAIKYGNITISVTDRDKSGKNPETSCQQK